MNNSIFKKYGYVWVTTVFFLVSLILHFIFGWYAFVDDQETHNQAVEVSQYWIQILRDMFENWQSEFLQLIWQVAGLAFLLYVGSPQSKEGDDRVEEKLDAILRSIDKNKGEDIIKRLEKKFPKK
jgi:hypothetical protein